MRLHNLLIVAASGIGYAMGAAIAIERDIADIDAIDSYRDPRFCQHENARIQLHMMTQMLNVWQTRTLGDVIRALKPSAFIGFRAVSDRLLRRPESSGERQRVGTEQGG